MVNRCKDIVEILVFKGIDKVEGCVVVGMSVVKETGWDDRQDGGNA